MLHGDYVGIVNHAYNNCNHKPYRLIMDLFEKIDTKLIYNNTECINIYNFKYSNPTEKEIFDYGVKLGMGVYGAILFQFYLDKI